MAWYEALIALQDDHAAMRTKKSLWHLVYITSVPDSEDGDRRGLNEGKSDVRGCFDSAASAVAESVVSRLCAQIDCWLLAYAEMSIRHGDVPRNEL
jgi:hypothetical protein